MQEPHQSVPRRLQRHPAEVAAMAGIVAMLFVPVLVALSLVILWRAIDWIRGNHEEAAETARDAAKGALIASKLAVFWSWLGAPTGMASIAAAIGITSPPLIVVAAPLVVAVAAAMLTVAAALELYSKWKKRNDA